MTQTDRWMDWYNNVKHSDGDRGEELVDQYQEARHIGLQITHLNKATIRNSQHDTDRQMDGQV